MPFSFSKHRGLAYVEIKLINRKKKDEEGNTQLAVAPCQPIMKGKKNVLKVKKKKYLPSCKLLWWKVGTL